MTAYELIKRNEGSLTPGHSPETMEGISLEKMKVLRNKLRDGSFV